MAAILTSGMGLGVYVPSLILHNQLKENGYDNHIYIYEEYFTEKAKKNMESYRKLFHSDFRAAIAGHKIPLHTAGKVENLELFQSLYEEWEKEDITHFIMLSGHWDLVLTEYGKRGHKELQIECLRLDCGITPSWRNYKEEDRNDKTQWLFGRAEEEILYKITVDNQEVIPFANRKEEYFVHGGGWGMGTYRDSIKELSGVGTLNITLYDLNEIDKENSDNQYYYMDADWKPWYKGDLGEYCFPPMRPLEEKEFINSNVLPSAYDITRRVIGIISKPGGGTLLDSISAATPIIFLPPIAEHERNNADYFISHGLGVDFDTWKASGYSKELLHNLHKNLMQVRENTTEYREYLLKQWDKVPATADK